MTILLVISKYDRDSSRIKEKILAQPQPRRFLLCPLNADVQPIVAEIDAFIRSRTSAESAVVPFSRRLLEHSLRVKDEYIRFISELGEREINPGVSLKEYFRCGTSDFSLWWLSLVYEKSPGKSEAFLRFSKLSLLVNLACENHCDQLWISCDGDNAMYVEALADVKAFGVSVINPRKKKAAFWADSSLFVRESLRVFKYFLFLIGVWTMMPRAGRRSFPDGCRRFVITMFPFFDVRKFENEVFYSKAYGQLQDGFEADQKPFVWLAMHTKIEPYTSKESYQLARKAKAFAPNFFSVDEWITFGDILRIDLDFLKTLSKFLSVFGQLRQVTTCVINKDCSVSLWPFLKEDFISSFAGKVAVVNTHHLRMFMNIANDLPQNSTIIHFAEMHGWERCLQLACARRGDIKVIALQHAHVPQMLLNYFDHARDLKDRNFLRSVPQPDYLGSVGTVIRDYFLKQGWPKERLFVIGGFRFHSLLSVHPQTAQSPKGPFVLVAAFSICYSENLEMLRMLAQAFNDGKSGIKIRVKSHPAESIEKMAKREGVNLDRNVFEFTETPLEAIVPEAGAMFACSTSAVFYAMACGKPVVVPCLYDAIDLCPLTNLYPYETRVDSYQQLKKVITEISAGHYDQSRQEALRKRLYQDYLALDTDPRAYFRNLRVYLEK